MFPSAIFYTLARLLLLKQEGLLRLSPAVIGVLYQSLYVNTLCLHNNCMCLLNSYACMQNVREFIRGREALEVVLY